MNDYLRLLRMQLLFQQMQQSLSLVQYQVDKYLHRDSQDQLKSLYKPTIDKTCIYTCPEKRVYSIFYITSSDTGRFSKFFHIQNLLEICNKAIIKYPTTPQTRHNTTL